MSDFKVITKKGGLTIPANIRRATNAFHSGDAVKIEERDGSLIITPHNPSCIFCRHIHNLLKYKEKYVCVYCIEALVDLGG